MQHDHTFYTHTVSRKRFKMQNKTPLFRSLSFSLFFLLFCLSLRGKTQQGDRMLAQQLAIGPFMDVRTIQVLRWAKLGADATGTRERIRDREKDSKRCVCVRALPRCTPLPPCVNLTPIPLAQMRGKHASQGPTDQSLLVVREEGGSSEERGMG